MQGDGLGVTVATETQLPDTTRGIENATGITAGTVANLTLVRMAGMKDIGHLSKYLKS